ncbi:uncharacterized protein LOC105692590 [Athalia rosae]|uniref:uncharacterized protein LOC105692590 n=1 Tax=Athalia rosae TaxID=37344 RepID=UPI0020341280|nr:uncharacterized protein LOC105692590 [Athalia rosae]XP_048509788.1 uncharacterized protein LOC105692590 [Athalia rosae]XP_048509789.1 uncharacterized protein LOC105692590 [Athalia rosae]
MYYEALLSELSCRISEREDMYVYEKLDICTEMLHIKLIYTYPLRIKILDRLQLQWKLLRRTVYMCRMFQADCDRFRAQIFRGIPKRKVLCQKLLQQIVSELQNTQGNQSRCSNVRVQRLRALTHPSWRCLGRVEAL